MEPEDRSTDASNVIRLPAKRPGASPIIDRVAWNGTPQPSIVVASFTVDEDSREFLGCAQQLRREVESCFKRWGWLDIIELHTLPHRYRLECEVGVAGDWLTAKVKMFVYDRGIRIIRDVQPTIIRKQIYRNNSMKYADSIENMIAEIFCNVKNFVFNSEYDSGSYCGWRSDNSNQCTLWSYLLWVRMTKECNVRARLLAKVAINIDKNNARAWAMYAQTYVQGIEYIWDDDLIGAKKSLNICALEALRLCKDDVICNSVMASNLLHNDTIDAAIKRMERVIADDYIFPAPVSYYGLMHSYKGEPREAKSILLKAAQRSRNDQALAMGLQYLGQAECLLGKYEEGLAAAQDAVKINPRSGPAWRTVAVNHAFRGELRKARDAYTEAEKSWSGFSIAAYKRQVWQPKILGRIGEYVEKMQLSGAPRD